MTALVNGGTPVTDDNSTKNLSPSVGNSQTKTMVTGSKTEGSRKQGNASNDPSARRAAPPQKAWTSGMNPITQRSTASSQPNGNIPRDRSHEKLEPQSSGADALGNERLLFIWAQSMGNKVSITTSNGDVYSGLFSGALPDRNPPEYLLKMVQLTKSSARAETNGVRESARDYVGVGKEHSMAFKIQDVHDFAVEGVLANNQDRRPNGSAAGFRTDTDIAGNRLGQHRELKPWTGPKGTQIDESLESSTSSGNWDQFAVNETRFGIQSSYDESIYTTKIDKSHPDFRQREANAQRLAQKMGESPSENSHDVSTWDEEDKYSGVRRDITDYPPLQSTQPNRYQPPARRPPSGKPTVAGAPVDPAIISSQIARPDSSTQTERDPPSEAASGSPSGKVSDPVSTSPKKQDTPKEDNVPKQATVQETPQSSLAKAPPSNATGSVEVDALKAFKQFSEKQKIRVADDRRARVMQDKNVKLNDLRGFSKNFKLNTPVPSDLVPILAKDKKKQDEIMEKAQRNAAEQAATPNKPQAKLGEPNGAKAVADLKHESSKVGQGSADRMEHSRQTGPPRGPQANYSSSRSRQMQHQYPMPMPAPNEQGLTHRLAIAQRNRETGVPVNIPTPLPIHSGKPPSRPGTIAPRLNGSQGSGALRTPTSATSGKFNVKADEFVPNANVKSKPSPRATSPSAFFGDKKPLPASERPSIMDHFKPLKRLVEKAEKDGKAKDYATNGGIAFAYTTPVTWSNFTDEGEGKSYKDLFGGIPGSNGASPRLSTASPINPDMPHQHQVPAHLQPRSHGTPVMQTPPQALYQVPPQQHLYPAAPQHFDEQRLHASPSLSTYSTPRMQSGYGGYPSPVGQHPMVGPAPANFQYQPTLGPGHPQMMNHGGQQGPPFRQFSGTPHFMPAPGQQLAAPLMVQQGSQGQYLPQGGPFSGHLPVYATGAVPQYGSSQPANGYPSPGRGAPMMMHQGSYPGQNAQMHAAGPQYGQPFYSPQPPQPNMGQMRGYSSPAPQYSQSPQQQYHYPPQPHRMPSHGYGHHSQGPPQMALQQHAAPGGSGDGGEGVK